MSVSTLDSRVAEAPLPVGWSLHHLSPVIGTEVHGVDLRKPLTDEMVAYLRKLLLERKVIFFRDQDISIERQMEVCRIWGDLEIIDFLPQHPDHPEVLLIKRDEKEKGAENVWHSDVTWRDQPSLGSMLRAVEVPEVGGDTMWACMYSAYDSLPEAIKRTCEGLEAVHSVANGLQYTQGVEKMQAMLKRFPKQVHPVIRTHPETGRKAIYVNRAHTSHIKGVGLEISEKLMQILCDTAKNPEFQCRFRWKKNSIAFWDNRSCQHYAVSDYYPAKREMYRVTVAGDRPF